MDQRRTDVAAISTTLAAGKEFEGRRGDDDNRDNRGGFAIGL
jgi:hypothetical protein